MKRKKTFNSITSSLNWRTARRKWNKEKGLRYLGNKRGFVNLFKIATEMLRSPTRSWGLSQLPCGGLYDSLKLHLEPRCLKLAPTKGHLGSCSENHSFLAKVCFMRGYFNFKKPQPSGTTIHCTKKGTEIIQRKCHSLKAGFFSPLSQDCQLYPMGLSPHKITLLNLFINQ